MSFSFSGPSSDIGLATMGGMMVGMLYTAVAKTNALSAVIFVIREVADSILYELVKFLFHGPTERSRAKIYAVTNLMVNVATLLLLRHMQLIGKSGTQIFSGLMAIEMVCKCVDFSKYQIDRVKS